MQSITLDIIAIVIILFSIFNMRRKGLIKSIYGVFSIVASIVLVTMLSAPVTNFINSSEYGKTIDNAVYENIVEKNNNQDNGETFTLDEQSIIPTSIADKYVGLAKETASDGISLFVKKLLAGVIIYVLSKFILYLLFVVLQGVFKLPLLNATNKLLGAILGAVIGVFIVYALCAIVSLDVIHIDKISSLIEDSYVVKYFYNNNILTSFIA